MRNGKTLGDGTLLPSTKARKKISREISRASKRPAKASIPSAGETPLAPRNAAAFKLANVLIYVCKEFERITSTCCWDEGTAVLDDLQNLVSHHPDLQEVSTSLKQLVEGYEVLTKLAREHDENASFDSEPKKDDATLARDNLLYYFYNRFIAAITPKNWCDNVAMMEELQSIVSYHPDLCSQAAALQNIVKGYGEVSRLVDQVNAL